VKTEKQVEDYLVEQSESQGCLCEKLVRKEGRGWPDRTIVTPHGVVGFPELKKPFVGTLSPQQIDTLKELGMRKAKTFVEDSKAGVDIAIASLMDLRLISLETLNSLIAETESRLVAERLSGNIVKMEFCNGQLSALNILLSLLK